MKSIEDQIEDLAQVQLDTVNEFVQLSEFTNENKRLIDKDVDLKIKMRKLAMDVANQLKRQSVEISVSTDGQLNLNGLFAVNPKDDSNE